MEFIKRPNNRLRDNQADMEIKEESNSNDNQNYDNEIHSEIEIKEDWHWEEQHQPEENTDNFLGEPNNIFSCDFCLEVFSEESDLRSWYSYKSNPLKKIKTK